MDFYTNVCRTRDKILVKGYQNNKPHMMKVSYRPNHYVLSKKGDTAFRSLDGRPLEAVNLDTMGGARKFREPIFGPDKALEKKNYPPGMHGPNKRRMKKSEYAVQLAEKQKAKYTLEY